jgi:hypothetical protein
MVQGVRAILLHPCVRKDAQWNCAFFFKLTWAAIKAIVILRGQSMRNAKGYPIVRRRWSICPRPAKRGRWPTKSDGGGNTSRHRACGNKVPLRRFAPPPPLCGARTRKSGRGRALLQAMLHAKRYSIVRMSDPGRQGPLRCAAFKPIDCRGQTARCL